MTKPKVATTIPAGHTTEDTHRGKPAPHMLCSDGSVFQYEGVAAAAWLVATSNEEFTKACFLMTDVSSVNSYRAELEGIFRSLHHMEQLGMDPETEVTQWCDNQAGIENCNHPPQSKKDVLAPEGDLILAIHHLKQRLRGEVIHRHVNGHQDTKRKKGRKSTADERNASDDDSMATTESTTANHNPKAEVTLSNEAMMNIACDELAGEVTAVALEVGTAHFPNPSEILQMPYQGSKAVLRIGEKWITARENRHLYAAKRRPKIREYIKRRRKWTDEQYDSVFWPKIGAVRRRIGFDQQRFTCKLMHGLLPVGHNRRHITGVAQCPGCPCADETIAHIFQCPNKEVVATRKEIIDDLRRKRIRKIPREVREAIADILQQYSTGERVNPRAFHPALRTAIRSQQSLGWENFFRGYLVKDWVYALSATSHSKDIDGYQHFDQLQQLIWFDIAQPQWYMRNRVAHGPASNLSIAATTRLTTLLVWYNEHKHEILPVYQLPLAKRSVDDIQRMTLATKKEWVRHLEVAITAWEKIKDSHNEKQHTMIEYLTNTVTIEKRKGVSAIKIARQQAEKTLPDVTQPRIDVIFASGK